MNTFQFKQFSVDQSNCAMKINTDGVLLGALSEVVNPLKVLDIGTGTGVIALMLAQRFSAAKIDAVEVDLGTSDTAARNFKNSPFSERLRVFSQSFQSLSNSGSDKYYDFVVSNPPFFIDSLKSQRKKIEMAKHTDEKFFSNLGQFVSMILSENGSFWVILPITTAGVLKEIMSASNFETANIIKIYSFEGSEPHREILCFKRSRNVTVHSTFIIYKSEKEYSLQYQTALKEFFTIF